MLSEQAGMAFNQEKQMTNSFRAAHAGQPVGRQGWALGMLLAGATALTVWSVNAWAASPAGPAGTNAPAAQAAMSHGHGGMMMGMPFEGRGLDRMLDTVKATDPQRKQIREIADKARADLQVLHGKLPPGADGQPVHPYHAMLALLAQPQVDAAGAEKLRQQLHAHHDQVSQRMLQAAVDIAKALTPEQRATFAKEMQSRMDRRGERMHRHHHGRDGGDRPAAR